MRTTSWWLLGLAVAGLAGCGVDSHQPAGRFDAKLEARSRLASADYVPQPGEDVCADNAWYGDGECDHWCPMADNDCDENVVCAAYIEESDGLCRRAAQDPCRGQDPDCDVSCVEPNFPGPDGVCAFDRTDPCVAQRDPDCNDGVTCARYIEMSDNVCSRPESDKCRFQDPDCNDIGPIECPAIAQFPDGVCSPDPNDPCVALSDPDCGGCNSAGAEDQAPIAPPISDGICNDDNDPCTPADPDCDDCGGFDGIRAAPPSDGVCEMLRCGAIDPDCEIACAEYIEVPDGVCDREPGDPCLFQDPDCDTSCLTPGVPPMADGVCEPNNDRCNVDPDCQVCAFFAPIPESDGVCNGDPNDPCTFQGDPDCNVVCALYIEVPDGQCNRFAKDPCISQDPDCDSDVGCNQLLPSPEHDMVCPFPLDIECRGWDPDCAVDLNQ